MGASYIPTTKTGEPSHHFFIVLFLRSLASSSSCCLSSRRVQRSTSGEAVAQGYGVDFPWQRGGAVVTQSPKADGDGRALTHEAMRKPRLAGDGGRARA
jgi:hypothetical protein